MSVFGGFADVEFVAEGGLGRVYRATRVSTGGVVAIKEIKNLDVGSPAWRRARREAEALVRLKGHPNVVSVEEIFDGPNGPCLVMEYLDGGSIADRLTTGPLPLDEWLTAGSSILSAIGAAHDAGIIHRDLKPHNVLVGGYGQIKVCDFGIAAIARDDSNTQTTASTLAYAAPEELDGNNVVGPPADVYSFSVTMIHLLTGHRPTFAERIDGDLRIPDRMTDRVPDLIESLKHGMRTRPHDRPTVAQFTAEFRSAARQLGQPDITTLASSATTGADLSTGTIPVVAPNPTKLRSPVSTANEPEHRLAEDSPTVLRSPTDTRTPGGTGPPAVTTSRRKRTIRVAAVVAIAIIVTTIVATISFLGGEHDVIAEVGDAQLTESDVQSILGDDAAELSYEVAGTIITNWIIDQVLRFDLAAGGNAIDPEGGELTAESQEASFDAAFSAWQQAEPRPISNEQVASAYGDGPSESGMVCVAHILVETEESADEIRAEFEAGGATFAELASEFSVDPGSATSGGTLPCSSLSAFVGTYVPEFTDAVIGTELGDVVGPVESQFGYHVIWIRPFDDLAQTDIDALVADDLVRFSFAADEAGVTVDPRFGEFSVASGLIPPD